MKRKREKGKVEGVWAGDAQALSISGCRILPPLRTGFDRLWQASGSWRARYARRQRSESVSLGGYVPLASERNLVSRLAALACATVNTVTTTH